MERRRRGAIRLRSNVVFVEHGQIPEPVWDLVPGEIVETYEPHYLDRPLISRKRQRDERGYYLSCTYCHRLAHEIGRGGCEDPRCDAPHPDSDEVNRNRARYHEALELIALEREHLDERHPGTEEEELQPLLDPEAAVERLFGAQSTAITTDERARGPEVAVAPAAPVAPAQLAARAALALAAAQTGRFTDGYCSTPSDNLVDALTLGQARAALADVARGDGSELRERGSAPPKFHAAHSSCALAVNTFAAWIGRESWLQIGGRAGFTSIRFETGFPTGLSGNPPTVDVQLMGRY